MYLLFYRHLTESLYQLTTQNRVLTITTLHQSSDNPATTRRSPGPNNGQYSVPVQETVSEETYIEVRKCPEASNQTRTRHW